jgi:hypothetical protein
MAYTYGTTPLASRLSKAERLALGRLYRDSELRGRSDSSWEFGLLTEEDQWLAKNCYETLLIKGDIDPDPATESPVLITKDGSYVSALTQKAQTVRRAIRRELVQTDSPADRATAWNALTPADRESYFKSWIGGDTIRTYIANRDGLRMEDLLLW